VKTNLRYMDRILAVLVLALICGCIQQVEEAETSTTTIEDALTTPTLMPTADSTSKTSTTSTIETIQATSTHTVTTTQPTTTTINTPIETFIDTGGEACRINGKPIIRMYGKRACHNCEWSGPIFDRVASEYAGKGLIIAHHWLLDRNDDTLTDTDEGGIPEAEYDIFFSDDNNTLKTVPYFNFGCRFTRVGNGYQVRDMPDKEEAEYRAVMEKLLET
jgi:hypothetical protein